MYSKEQDGRVHNPTVQFSIPWWSAQYVHGNNHDDHPNIGLGQAKRGGNHFTISCEDSGEGEKTTQPRIAVSEQSAIPVAHSGFELAYGQQMICAKHPYVDQFYGLFSAYGPQHGGRIMLPISMTTDEGPIYVNAKQYHGIMRRRKSRAKAELGNKVQKDRKPYLHESRHRHAMRRARGTGGRFLGSKNSGTAKPGNVSQNSRNGCQIALPTTVSLSSDSKDTNGSSSSLTLSGPEVTSTYPRGDFDIFQFNGLHPSVCSMANAMGGGDRVVTPHKWCPESGHRYNLKV